jgi:hypothetical protein
MTTPKHDPYLSTLDFFQHPARISERWIHGRLFVQVCAWHDAWDRLPDSCVRDAERIALALDPEAKISHGICKACAERLKVDPLPIR